MSSEYCVKRRYRDFDFAKVAFAIHHIVNTIIEMMKIMDTIEHARDEANKLPNSIGVKQAYGYVLPEKGTSKLSKLIYPLKKLLAKMKGGIDYARANKDSIKNATLYNLLREVQNIIKGLIAKYTNRVNTIKSILGIKEDSELARKIQSKLDILLVHLTRYYSKISQTMEKLFTDLMAKNSIQLPDGSKSKPNQGFVKVPGTNVEMLPTEMDRLSRPSLSRSVLAKSSLFEKLKSQNKIGGRMNLWERIRNKKYEKGPVIDIPSSNYSVKRDSRFYKDDIATEIENTLNNTRLIFSFVQAGDLKRAFLWSIAGIRLTRIAYADWVIRKKDEFWKYILYWGKKARDGFNAGKGQERNKAKHEIINSAKKYISSLYKQIIDVEKSKALLEKSKSYVKDGKLKEAIKEFLSVLATMLKSMLKRKSEAEQESRQAVSTISEPSKHKALGYEV